MPINIDYYVNITSGVGGVAQIPQRQLVPLFFDDNALIPSGSYVNFPNLNNAAANVAAYFGSTSIEYKRALFAFGWVSKSIQQVPSISFARWNSAACAPVVYGDPAATTTVVATWNTITSGSLTLVMGATTHTLTGLNFSGAGSLAAVATDLQTAIQAISAGGSLWTAATVSYDATNARFIITGGATGAEPISITAGVSNDCAVNFGFLSPSAIFGPGAAIQTITQAIQSLVSVNNNFGSFGFTGTNTPLTTPQIVEAATVNNGYNNLFMYSIPCTLATESAIQAAVAAIGGCTTTLTIDGDVTQFEEMDPMMTFGATNYNAPNGTQNFMFQQFPGQVPAVTTDTAAATHDALGVNYYANTQDNGAIVSLYQTGVMNGGATSPASQNTYANECWFKSFLQAAIFNLLLALNKISANLRGQSQVLAILQSGIQLALTNGTISVGRTLTPVEILYITNQTNDPSAWQQVQNIGYWVTTNITTAVVGGKTKYIINYTLIYAADDVVNKITGTDIQI